MVRMNEIFSIRSKQECTYDLVALGEVMLRLDPGEDRIRTARCFRVWEGGGEYNVAKALRRCFGLRTAICTALADNEVGRLIEGFILEGGVDTRFIKWIPYDGVGRLVRNGLNFTERGFGVRGAVGVPDRGHTAASQLKPGDFDWEFIFGNLGVRWFHTGGIFAAIGPNTADLILEALQCAKKHGVIVSYDLNYRPSLWKGLGGLQKARQINKVIAPFIDVMLGNEEDFTACLGFEVEGIDENISHICIDSYKKMIEQVASTFPNLKVIATSLRVVKTASRNDWGGICWVKGQFYESTYREDLEILDRVGGGDGFASGLIYGLMELADPKLAVEYAAAHGALVMSTPGDTTMVSLDDVRRLVEGKRPRIQR